VFFEAASSVGERGSGALPWDPLKAIVAPRPIGWVTTRSPDGVVNLAPYSFFNAVADKPAIVFFSAETGKHSQANAEATGEFVLSLATWDLREQVNATSASLDADESEPAAVGVELAPSRLVAPPRVAASPTALECVYLETHVPRTRSGDPHVYALVFGQVVGVHVDDAFVRDGRLETAAMRPIARMGYDEYAVVEQAFRMVRPS
jgi:flavin reductase (DIM6/NTAB) family NADH-FMN oxidoreductase RutF